MSRRPLSYFVAAKWTGKKVLLKLPPVRHHRRAPATGRPEQEQRTQKLLLRHLREGGDGQPVAQESLRQHQGPGDHVIQLG